MGSRVCLSKSWEKRNLPLSSKPISIQRALQKFRIVTARAIFSNLPHTDVPSVDIDHTHHITELCDQYALKILASWIATKYGFPHMCRLSIRNMMQARLFLRHGLCFLNNIHSIVRWIICCLVRAGQPYGQKHSSA